MGERIAYPPHHHFSLVPQLPGADTHDQPPLGGEKLQSLNILSCRSGSVQCCSPSYSAPTFHSGHPMSMRRTTRPHSFVTGDLGYGTRHA